ncbi:MAG: AtpZ/AtpI family protein [Patescibacteria group bacterium]|nr:AtpZ/AtpI family protein [Patescibacteria group bacterium]
MKENQSLAKGVLMYISFSVLGPLLTIGAIGYVLDNIFGTKPFMLLGSVLIAYVLSNFLVFKKIKEFNASLEKIEREAKKESLDEKEENK